MAHILGPMRLVAEVDVLEQQVGGEQQIPVRSARPEDGAIVSDPKPKVRA